MSIKKIIDGEEVKVYKLIFPFSIFSIAMCWNMRLYYIKPKSILDSILRHELVHREQQRCLGFVKFLLLYFGWWLRRGYKKIPFEREAYDLQKYERGWDRVEEKSYLNYK